MNQGNKVALGVSGLGALLVGWLLFSPRPSPTSVAPAASTLTGVTPALAASSAELPVEDAQQPQPNGKLDAISSVAIPPETEEAPKPTLPVYTGPARDRARADQLRAALATMFTAQAQENAQKNPQEKQLEKTPPTVPPPMGDGNQADKPLGQYVARIMQDQFVPLAGSCYEELLARHPTAAGNVVLDFSVMGDPAVGGVVVDVGFGTGTTLKDEEFATCTRESMYSVIFDAPPKGSPTVTVSQSFELAP